MKKGSLFLIPTFLAETNDQNDFPLLNHERVGELDHFIVENLRTARRFLRKTGYAKPFDDVEFYTLNKHTEPSELTSFLKVADEGKDIGLLSEAGVPCVADPGAEIVSLAHQRDLKVKPLVGPSSVFLALMASGFNGQQFVFHGYLPIDRNQRENKIKELERAATQQRQTQIFIETPYRNNQLLESILKTCHGNLSLCLGSMLTHDSLEFVRTKTIAQWKSNKPDLHKKPTVFLLY